MIPIDRLELLEDMPLSKLSEYKSHRRLGVFVYKGKTCVCCGVKGTKLLAMRDTLTNSVHVDLYTDDGMLMTVDHIIPRSFGGRDNLENKQPMCSECNQIKGNLAISIETLRLVVNENKANRADHTWKLSVWSGKAGL